VCVCVCVCVCMISILRYGYNRGIAPAANITALADYYGRVAAWCIAPRHCVSMAEMTISVVGTCLVLFMMSTGVSTHQAGPP